MRFALSFVTMIFSGPEQAAKSPGRCLPARRNFARNIGTRPSPLVPVYVPLLVTLLCHGLPGRVLAQHAVEVVAYDQGSTAAAVFGSDPAEFFNVQSAALGAPERSTGEGVFPGPVTPFNPPFLASEVLSIGEGGQVTLRLSHFVIPQSGGPEIGVFTNSGLIDVDFPNGRAGDPAGTFGVDNASVDVSADGVHWVSLGVSTFDAPSNGYQDVAQTETSDYQQPFTEPVSRFAGLAYSDPAGVDLLDVFDGSGGGKWLDISPAGLGQVGYLRFSVADDNDAISQLNFELDAISIAMIAMGAETVPEPSSSTLVVLAGLTALGIRRRRQAIRGYTWA